MKFFASIFIFLITASSIYGMYAFAANADNINPMFVGLIIGALGVFILWSFS